MTDSRRGMADAILRRDSGQVKFRRVFIGDSRRGRVASACCLRPRASAFATQTAATGRKSQREAQGREPEEGHEPVGERAQRVAAPVDERVDEALRGVLLLARHDREEGLARGLHERELGRAAEDLDGEERARGRGRGAEREEARRRDDRQQRERGPEAHGRQDAAREEELREGREDVDEEVGLREERRAGAGVVEGAAHDARLREVEERRADREEEEERRDAEEVARLREEREARESARAGRDAVAPFAAAALVGARVDAVDPREPVEAEDAGLEEGRRDEEERHRADAPRERDGDGAARDAAHGAAEADEPEEALGLLGAEEVGEEPPEDRHDEEVEDARVDEEEPPRGEARGARRGT